MHIKSDLLHITNAPTKDDGTPAEPEEQTASRILTTDAPTETTATGAVGSIPAQIVTQVPVVEFARALRANCSACKHFDNPGFVEFFRKADDPTAPLMMRETMNEIRAALLITYNASVADVHAGADGDMDVEHAIRAMGWCHALGEAAKDYVAVHPLSSCPDEVITPTSPDGFFKPRDNAAEKTGARAYDSVMNRASGKAT